MGTAENAGSNPAMDYIVGSHPGESRNTPSRFMLQKRGISTSLMGVLACAQRLYVYLKIKKTKEEQEGNFVD